MHVAITGGTGFLGRHLVRRLRNEGHSVRVLARGRRRPRPDGDLQFVEGDVADRSAVEKTVQGADAVAHLAGINFERGTQTYERVHVRGTAHVVEMAGDADVDALVVTSYLRARPGTGSDYFESKWQVERLVRAATVPGTILKPAGIFGEDDQLLTNLGRWFRTAPVLPVPIGDPPLRPVAIEDVVDVLVAALVDDRLVGRTVPLTGPETLSLEALARRVGRRLGRRGSTLPGPEMGLRAGAFVQEKTLTRPIVTRASLRMLAEGMVDPAPADVCDPLPSDLSPSHAPTPAYVRRVLDPPPSRLHTGDLRIG